MRTPFTYLAYTDEHSRVTTLILQGGSSLDAFMTEDQKKYINAMKKASTKKPLKALPRPYWKPQALVFAVITNKKFDMIIMGFIGLNMVS